MKMKDDNKNVSAERLLVEEPVMEEEFRGNIRAYERRKNMSREEKKEFDKKRKEEKAARKEREDVEKANNPENKRDGWLKTAGKKFADTGYDALLGGIKFKNPFTGTVTDVSKWMRDKVVGRGRKGSDKVAKNYLAKMEKEPPKLERLVVNDETEIAEGLKLPAMETKALIKSLEQAFDVGYYNWDTFAKQIGLGKDQTLVGVQARKNFIKNASAAPIMFSDSFREGAGGGEGGGAPAEESLGRRLHGRLAIMETIEPTSEAEKPAEPPAGSNMYPLVMIPMEYRNTDNGNKKSYFCVVYGCTKKSFATSRLKALSRLFGCKTNATGTLQEFPDTPNPDCRPDKGAAMVSEEAGDNINWDAVSLGDILGARRKSGGSKFNDFSNADPLTLDGLKNLDDDFKHVVFIFDDGSVDLFDEKEVLQKYKQSTGLAVLGTRTKVKVFNNWFTNKIGSIVAKNSTMRGICLDIRGMVSGIADALSQNKGDKEKEGKAAAPKEYRIVLATTKLNIKDEVYQGIKDSNEERAKRQKYDDNEVTDFSKDNNLLTKIMGIWNSSGSDETQQYTFSESAGLGEGNHLGIIEEKRSNKNKSKPANSRKEQNKNRKAYSAKNNRPSRKNSVQEPSSETSPDSTKNTDSTPKAEQPSQLKPSETPAPPPAETGNNDKGGGEGSDTGKKNDSPTSPPPENPDGPPPPDNPANPEGKEEQTLSGTYSVGAGEASKDFTYSVGTGKTGKGNQKETHTFIKFTAELDGKEQTYYKQIDRDKLDREKKLVFINKDNKQDETFDLDASKKEEQDKKDAENALFKELYDKLKGKKWYKEGQKDWFLEFEEDKIINKDAKAKNLKDTIAKEYVYTSISSDDNKEYKVETDNGTYNIGIVDDNTIDISGDRYNAVQGDSKSLYGEVLPKLKGKDWFRKGKNDGWHLEFRDDEFAQVDNDNANLDNDMASFEYDSIEKVADGEYLLHTLKNGKTSKDYKIKDITDTSVWISGDTYTTEKPAVEKPVGDGQKANENPPANTPPAGSKPPETPKEGKKEETGEKVNESRNSRFILEVEEPCL